MNIREASEEIKRTVSMEQILNLYGYQPDRSGFMRCPFHSGDHTASLKVYSNGRGWTCFGCHKGGTVVDFVMHSDGVSFADAVRNIDSQLSLHLLEVKQEQGGLDGFRRRAIHRHNAESVKRQIQSAHDDIRLIALAEYDTIDSNIRRILQKPKQERTGSEDAYILNHRDDCNELFQIAWNKDRKEINTNDDRPTNTGQDQKASSEDRAD